MANYIITFFCCLNGVFLHDFHLSVCDIEFDKENKALEITHRIFLDDLEQTLIKWSGDENVDVYNPKDEKVLNDYIGGYLLEKFNVSVNGKNQELIFLGSEKEDDVMYCYIEMTKISKVKSIKISNSLLMESFDDQTNLVHFKNDGETFSTHFSSPAEVFEKEF